MINSYLKYNPGFIEDDQTFIDLFVVRHDTLALIMETIRDNTGPANQHVLIIGPRGAGKTMLVHRIAAEIHTNPSLNQQWFPLIFMEEAYEVTTPGEFWLAALSYLAAQTQDQRWQRTHDELRRERDDRRLQNRCLSELMDFADSQRKKILFMVENLNILLGEQLSADDDWGLRHVFMNESRLMLLGTSTCDFEEVKHIEKAFFEAFQRFELSPLSVEESQILWEKVTDEKISINQIKPMRILTGGSPRLLSILAKFAIGLSFRQLIDNLVHLIDDYTEYFKSRLDNLPPIERKVFVALLEIWDPASASQIAEHTRLDASKVSALLNRLVNKGAVEIADSSPRKKLYQVAERLYNIYYLMRKRRDPHTRVQLVVEFMLAFYQERVPGELAKVAHEACLLEPEHRQDHHRALMMGWERMSPLIRAQLLRALPEEYLNLPDLPELLREQRKQEQDNPKLDMLELLQDMEQRLQVDPDDYETWNILGGVLYYQGRLEEALASCNRAREIKPDAYEAWCNRGVVLYDLGRKEEALASYDRTLEIKPDYYQAWCNRGVVLYDLGCKEEALASYDRTLEIKSDDHQAWYNRGLVLYDLVGAEDALASYDRALEIKPDYCEAWYNRGVVLYLQGHLEEALASYDRAFEIKPDAYEAWYNRGIVLSLQGHLEEALASYDRTLEIKPDCYQVWHKRGIVLEKLKNYPEALVSLTHALMQAPADWMVQDINDLVIRLAIAGYAKEALKIIEESMAYEQLQPLAVGLRIYLGEKPSVAKEIYEIGLDVAERIRSGPQPPAPPPTLG